MRRIAALFCIVSMLLGGCTFWMSGEYLSVSPHEPEGNRQSNEVIEVTSYTQLRNTLKSLTEKGVEDAVLSASSFNETTLDFYVNTAINDVTDSTAIGAYALRKITYEIGTNLGEPVVAFRMEYKHEPSEIEKLKRINTADALTAEITAALDDCRQSVAMYVENYEAFDFPGFISEYADRNPDKVMEIPYVSVATYPASGKERIIEVTLTYLTEKEHLLEMQRQVQSVFTSAELYVKESAKVMDIYSRLYSFLMERSEYVLETSLTPSYSLLHEGIGDSRAFAAVYAAMCRKAGLDCEMVTGLRDGEAWCWNVLRYRGKQYHVDLVCCNENSSFVLTDGKDMQGYEWDTSVFPKD